MSSSLRRMLVLLLAAAALTPAGCDDAADQAATEALQADPLEISPEQRDRADISVRELWAELDQATPADLPLSDHQAVYALDLAALTRGPHRLAGFADGSLVAAEYVQNRLLQAGVQEVFTQDFTLVQPVYTQCRLAVDGREYGVADGFVPCRPNMLQASITPAEGLSGRTIYVGQGEPSDYPDTDPQDAIVVLDFDCGDNWLYAFAFGARAVIFIGSDSPAERVGQHLNLPSNLPRFYVTPELAEQLDLTQPRDVELHAACEWRTLRGRNVIGHIPPAAVDGDAPGHAGDAMFLTAPLDSYSETPMLSPGARDAANAAGLLSLADRLAARPGGRHVVVCFFDAQTQSQLGARAFYGAVFREIDGVDADDYPERMGELTGELTYRQNVRAVISRGELFSDEARQLPDHLDAIRELADRAKSLGGAVLDELSPLRIRRAELQRREQPVPEALQTRIDLLAAEDLGFNGVVRVLVQETPIGELEATVAGLRAQSEQAMADGDEQRAADLAARAQEQADVLAKIEFVRQRTLQAQSRRIEELGQLVSETRTGYQLQSYLGPHQMTPVLQISLNFGDARRQWTFVHGDDPTSDNEDKGSTYQQINQSILELAEAAEGVGHFDGRPISRDFSNHNRRFAPATIASPGLVVRMFRLFNTSAMTVHDRLPRQGQPCDTLDAMDAQVVLDQVNEFASLLRGMLDAPDLSRQPGYQPTARYSESGWSLGQSTGLAVRRSGGGTALADRTVDNAIVAVYPLGTNINNVFSRWPTYRIPPGYNLGIVSPVNANGVFEIPPHCRKNYNQMMFVAATFDAPPVRTTAEILAGDAPDYRSRGLIRSITTRKTLTSNNARNFSVNLWRCRSQTVVGYGFARGSIVTLTMRALSTAVFRPDRHLACEQDAVLTLFAPWDARGYKLFNRAGICLLNNSPQADEYQGVGYPLGDPFDHPVAVRHTAHDLAALNEYRLNLLRDNRIHQDSLELLNGQAQDLFQDAAPPTTNPSAAAQPADGAIGPIDRQAGQLSASGAYARRVYKPLTDVLNDLVTAVVLLLLLAMPFAFSLERLLVGTPHIYRQIGWFAAFFLATFGVLFVVNPAFIIATTPVIIFLAFAIILLSCLVIFIMMRKLQTEIRKMQGAGTTVHSADVSRLSTMMAAVGMGISTMRRRPVRTLLTAVTVVLLTFTILTFASFGNQYGSRRTYESPMSGSTRRIMTRHLFWNPLGSGIDDALRGYLAQDATVVPRWWVAPTAQQAADDVKYGTNRDQLLATEDGERFVTIAAAIGIDIRDVRRQPELGQLLDGDTDMLAEDGLFCTQAAMADLGLDESDVGARVLLAGHSLRLAGVLSDQAASYVSLDGSSLLPVDFQASGGGGNFKPDQVPADAADVESAQFLTYDVDSVVVVPPRVAQRMGGAIRALAIYPDRPDEIHDLAERVSTVTELPVYLGDGGGVYRLIFTSLTRALGWRDLLVPVLLGGLIIFATMLGSVSDREREIYTFSSLGLAPPHVASLFFAEAAVYAVVGGMGGYLFGQIVARVLGWMSSLGWVSVPTMNYSSTNAIATILIVMGTVLVSTIYPAIKASRSANPGIQRAWKPPRPVDDTYDLIFPFTVSAYDITGVVSFLAEHFENFGDAAIGSFATMRCEVFRQTESDMLGFGAEVALAPFDLGVNQQFSMLSRPSEIEGIDEVRIIIRRTAGARGDWIRANKVFINDLRKQLLIWRSIPAELMEKYRERTLEAWDSLPVRGQKDLSGEAS